MLNTFSKTYVFFFVVGTFMHWFSFAWDIFRYRDVMYQRSFLCRDYFVSWAYFLFHNAITLAGDVHIVLFSFVGCWFSWYFILPNWRCICMWKDRTCSWYDILIWYSSIFYINFFYRSITLDMFFFLICDDTCIV